MKTIHRLLLTLLVVVSIAGCKDDDGNVDPEVSIVGDWKGDRSDVQVSYTVITFYDETDDVFDVLLEFHEDGTVSFTRQGNVTDGTYQLNGDKLTTNVDFQMEGVDLSNVTFDVIELSETKLRLHLDKDQPVNVPDLGEVTAKIKADLAFDRVP